jgi:hypothetical protein
LILAAAHQNWQPGKRDSRNISFLAKGFQIRFEAIKLGNPTGHRLLDDVNSPIQILTDFYNRVQFALDQALSGLGLQTFPRLRGIGGKFEPHWLHTEMTRTKNGISPRRAFFYKYDGVWFHQRVIVPSMGTPVRAVRRCENLDALRDGALDFFNSQA